MLEIIVLNHKNDNCHALTVSEVQYILDEKVQFRSDYIWPLPPITRQNLLNTILFATHYYREISTYVRNNQQHNTAEKLLRENPDLSFQLKHRLSTSLWASSKSGTKLHQYCEQFHSNLHHASSKRSTSSWKSSRVTTRISKWFWNTIWQKKKKMVTYPSWKGHEGDFKLLYLLFKGRHWVDGKYSGRRNHLLHYCLQSDLYTYYSCNLTDDGSNQNHFFCCISPK